MSDAREPTTRHPHGHHPASGRTSARNKPVRRIGGSVLVVVLLAVIVALQQALPNADRKYRPLATKGHVGEVVRTPDFRIQVDKVRVARRVAQPPDALGSDEAPKATQAIWVIVSARAASEREPIWFDWPLGVALVTRDGHRYAATSLGGLVQAKLETDLWKYGPIVFEVPPDLLAGARLRITTETQHSLNSEADIFLDLDEAEARRLIKKAPKTYVLEDVRYV